MLWLQIVGNQEEIWMETPMFKPWLVIFSPAPRFNLTRNKFHPTP